MDQQNAADERGSVAFQTPILKVCQALTKEVKSGDAVAGEFLNTLTGESYGTAVEFIVSFFQYGRSASDKKTGRYYVATDIDVIPASWKDLVGEEFVGTRFDEYPDAEEKYKERVNAGEIKWDSGPLISTTYNYTGSVYAPAIEGDDSAPESMPVRISFLRTTKPTHAKLQTLRRALLRNKPWWEVVFELETVVKPNPRGDSFIVNVKKVRGTTADEKSLAIELAQAVVAGRTVDNAEQSEAGSARVEPDAAGGLGL